MFITRNILKYVYVFLMFITEHILLYVYIGLFTLSTSHSYSNCLFGFTVGLHGLGLL